MNCIFKISKTTEKAIAIKAWGKNSYGKDIEFDYWVPKSIINPDGTIPAWFTSKKDEDLFYTRDIEHIILESA